jgi:hypothetical protein
MYKLQSNQTSSANNEQLKGVHATDKINRENTKLYDELKINGNFRRVTTSRKDSFCLIQTAGSCDCHLTARETCEH